ncbi:SRPBCC domain-containing protein [Nocardia vinacea]|uniref:SRPBCC family protein n=1 Tax=Nocardia vinacea TaxID=96468 RepID=UPI0034157FBB
MIEPVRVPDLSSRPYGLEVERTMTAPPPALYRAWTERFDQWFATPGSVLMRPAVNGPFFFETAGHAQPAPRTVPPPGSGSDRRADRVTGAGGTEGAETVVTVELVPTETGTRLRLAHAGFADEAARDRHSQAWPPVLEQLDRRTAVPA